MTVTAVERRGRTEIADKVAARIAVRSAAELPEVLRVTEGGPPWAHASGAKVDEGTVLVHLSVTVAYPAPLRTLSERIRDHVASRVAELTGLPVGRVDLTIEAEAPT